MTELTFEEFCGLPWMYVTGLTTDSEAHRMHRNNEYGLQSETITARKVRGDIYSGWKEGVTTYYLDGDNREFSSIAELYEAWMEKVCHPHLEVVK
jgi:hypothetical protein